MFLIIMLTFAKNGLKYLDWSYICITTINLITDLIEDHYILYFIVVVSYLQRVFQMEHISACNIMKIDAVAVL